MIPSPFTSNSSEKSYPFKNECGWV